MPETLCLELSLSTGGLSRVESWGREGRGGLEGAGCGPSMCVWCFILVTSPIVPAHPSLVSVGRQRSVPNAPPAPALPQARCNAAVVKGAEEYYRNIFFGDGGWGL